MITIIIFTSNRTKEFKELYEDIIKNISNINNKPEIIIVTYGNSAQNNNIKKIINKKFCRFFEENKNLTLAEKLTKYFLKAKKDFIWWIGDDDRISEDSLKKINLIIKNNPTIPGFTINYLAKKNINFKFYKDKYKKIFIKNIDLKSNLHILGMGSTQIINKKLFIQTLEEIKNKYINKDYFHLYIILKIIYKYKNWKIIKNCLVVYRVNNYNYNNEQILNRLNSEFEGYLIPIKKIFDKKKFNLYFKNVFFKNIISWILYNIKFNGKIKTFKIIYKNKKLIPSDFKILIILVLLLIIPLFCINFFKKFYLKYFK